MVENNIRHAGAVLLGPVPIRGRLKKALAMTPGAIIDTIEASGLRGCGGAGFPTGTEVAARGGAGRAAHRHLQCRRGRAGHLQGPRLLTERPHLLVEGMTIAARAVGAPRASSTCGASTPICATVIEDVLADRRARGLLGKHILGVGGFDFDIRIQMGAGAYICGEEGALISSCEGLPGEPKNRPPFPVNRGYLGYPTVVNNVETFCHAARILDRGAQWFFDMGRRAATAPSSSASRATASIPASTSCPTA
jgi:[NiFe] hydrogenase diaphorase moiety large subunit